MWILSKSTHSEERRDKHTQLGGYSRAPLSQKRVGGSIAGGGVDAPGASSHPTLVRILGTASLPSAMSIAPLPRVRPCASHVRVTVHCCALLVSCWCALSTHLTSAAHRVAEPPIAQRCCPHHLQAGEADSMPFPKKTKQRSGPHHFGRSHHFGRFWPLLVNVGSVSSLFEVFQTCENLYYAPWTHMTSLEPL